MLRHFRTLPLLAGSLAAGAALGQPSVTPARILVDVGRPGARIAPEMWGVFFEDINFGADGGLVAELVKNGSFEFPDRLMAWREVARRGGLQAGQVAAVAAAPSPGDRNSHYVRLTGRESSGDIGIENEGFRGMGVREGEGYRLSLRLRRPPRGAEGVRCELVAPDGRRLAGAELAAGARWAVRTARLRPAATEAHARLRLFPMGSGEVEVDNVSLCPERTWRNRRGGLRRDLVQLLADLKPGFIRFPGGCIVEGSTLALRYQWKDTIGPREQRRLLINRWNNVFRHRPTPDYYQSFALGFLEYFQICEDLGAEPMPILNCGMACQFNSGELAPLDRLDPYIQDALDLVEFAAGPVSSPWGRRRADLGHPRPFSLKYLGIGNEQWGPQYLERYDRFAAAIKSRYPEIQLVAAAGPSPSDERFQFLWSELRKRRADVVDEHSYAAPDWFLDASRRYDSYDRGGPKVFMGEYAAQSAGVARPDNRNTWLCALSEAAFMTGLERNADIVRLSSYAPLFAHAEAWQWTPNLIWFDNLRSVRTANYLVQQAFSRNRGDRVLATTVAGAPAAPNGEPRVFASSVLAEKAGEAIVKIVNATGSPQALELQLSGFGDGRLSYAHTLIEAAPEAENTLENPEIVRPVTGKGTFPEQPIRLTAPPYSLRVLRIKLR